MTKEEYKKLIDLTLDLRTISSILCEAVALLEKINKTLRELVLRDSIEKEPK